MARKLRDILAEANRHHPLKKAFRQGSMDAHVKNEREADYQGQQGRGGPHDVRSRTEILNDRSSNHYSSKPSKDLHSQPELKSLRSKRKGDTARAYKAGREHEESGHADHHSKSIGWPLAPSMHGHRNGHAVDAKTKARVKATAPSTSNDNSLKPAGKDYDHHSGEHALNGPSTKFTMKKDFVKLKHGTLVRKGSFSGSQMDHMKKIDHALHRSKFKVVKNDEEK